MVTCSSDGRRCGSPRFKREFYRTKVGSISWVDSSVQCLSCGAGWVERMEEPLDD
jgi:hypothetical protein